MTLNDLQRRNSPHFAFFSSNLIALLANYVTVVEDDVCKILFPRSSLTLLDTTDPPCSAVSRYLFSCVMTSINPIIQETHQEVR